MIRQARQRDEIAAALARGEIARVLVLGREHLDEFPGDLAVRDAVEKAAQRLDQRTD